MGGVCITRLTPDKLHTHWDEVVCALPRVLTSLTNRLFMNLSFVLWQVWMQLVM